VVVIPDASHALIPEQPEAVVQAVRDWTRTH
jgi:pimeloyl-ACP methyl ester carboxylesterase